MSAKHGVSDKREIIHPLSVYSKQIYNIMENSLLQSAYRKGKYSEIAKGEKKTKKKKKKKTCVEALT